MKTRLSRARVLALVLACAIATPAARALHAARAGGPAQRGAEHPEWQAERRAPQQPADAQAAKPPVNADAAILKDFKDRIDAYMKVRGREEKGKADPKETSSPEKIKATQDELAARIQAARKDAKAGDIFTPEIQQLFRRLMYPEMKGPDAQETKKTIKEDSKVSKAEVLKVNGRYPEGAPLPTVPPNLLMRLPQLPEELEYRIVNKDLILRDVNANLIVDFIANAIR